MSYTRWKSDVEFLKTKLADIPGLAQRWELVAIHGEGQKNEAILHQVIKRLEITQKELPLLEAKIELIEKALSALTPEEKLFVEVRYIDKLALPLAMDRLALSKSGYFFKRKCILKKMYEEMRRSKWWSWMEPLLNS